MYPRQTSVPTGHPPASFLPNAGITDMDHYNWPYFGRFLVQVWKSLCLLQFKGLMYEIFLAS